MLDALTIGEELMGKLQLDPVLTFRGPSFGLDRQTIVLITETSSSKRLNDQKSTTNSDARASQLSARVTA